jgi:purine-binding chemotaxis protein CheW
LTRFSADNPTTLQKALAVRLGEDLHAIPIAAIEEILPALPIEPIPQTPAFVRGVISVRGHLIPVLDAAERLRLKNHRRPDEPHIICVRVGDRLIGLEVDEALDLIDLGQLPMVLPQEMGSSAGFFAGVVELEDKVVRILDPQRVLDRDETAELQQVPRTA